jgi:hypothetical protein
MTWLVAVDPGIDAAGVATFQLDDGHHAPWRPGENFACVIARLGPTTVLRTKPSEDLVPRLRSLGAGFARFTELPGPIETILLEQPAAPGSYAGKRGRQRTKGIINGAALVKLYLALGVLVDASVCNSELATDGRVELVPASRVQKELRLDIVRRELERQNHLLIKKGRVSPDLLDAIYLGAAWLCDARRVLERAIAN